MKLNRSQKKFLKKNLKTLSLKEISQKLGFSEKELQNYLQSIWPKEKYQRFAAKTEALKAPRTVARPLAGLLRGEIFLAFLVFAVYFNSLKNDFVSDDITAIVQNENIGNFAYYLPHQSLNFLRYFFYSLTYHLAGLNPLFFRLINNLLFHLGSVLVIYFLVKLLYQPLLGLIVASVFAVHPVLSETVVWISGGVHSQYAFFLFLAFFLYLRKKQPLAMISFLLALFTTEKAIIFPLILLSFEFAFGRLKKNWQRLIPFFCLSAFWGISLLSGGILGQRMSVLQSQFYQQQGFYNPLIQIPTAISSYLQLIFWPIKLTLYHSETVFSQNQYLLMLLTTIGFFGLALFFLAQKKYRPYFFWLSFFVIGLLPMLTPFKIAWVVAERYIYFSSLGIFVLVGLAIQGFFKYTSEVAEWTPRRWVFLIIIIALSWRTIIRNQDWQNQDTLWLAATKTSPSSPQNHNNLGDLYGRQGDYQKAIEAFKKAIELQPNYADAYHNLANTYSQINEIDLAIANYQKALEINPQLWQSHQNLAAIYYQQGEKDLATQELEKALEINPDLTP